MTLFTPSHLERLSERNWMNLESHGFPVHLYAERARDWHMLKRRCCFWWKSLDTEVHVVDATIDADKVQLPVLEAQQAEKAGTPADALTQLANQIPQPNPVPPGVTENSLQQFALLTREFNRAMGLPEGATMKIVTAERGQQYGRMLREEIRELEEAIVSGVPHDVLAELTDVIYLTLNLGQECGLQEWLETAFLMKHSDNMRKQHDSVTHLSWTRTAHARACNCTEEGPDLGSEHPERASQPLHTSGHDSSQYTFAYIGIEATMCDNHPKRATDQTGQHGWQSALMTSMMWLSNVVGEYLNKLDQKPEVAPVRLPRLIDDPVSTLEQTVMDMQIAHEAKDVSNIL